MAPPSCETQVMNRPVWLMKNGFAGMNECLLRRSELRIAIAGLLNIKKAPAETRGLRPGGWCCVLDHEQPAHGKKTAAEQADQAECGRFGDHRRATDFGIFITALGESPIKDDVAGRGFRI